MFTLPYLIGAALIAVAVAFGGGWHYGGKAGAREVGALTAQLQAATDTNARLSASVDTVRADCKAALDKLRADVKRRSAAVKAAKKAASDSAAEQRGTINGLKLRAINAKDSEQNCAEATKILDQLAKDRQK